MDGFKTPIEFDSEQLVGTEFSFPANWTGAGCENILKSGSEVTNWT